MEFTELMNGFAGLGGVSDFSSNIEDGTCQFDVDGMTANFVEMPETRRLVTWAAKCPVRSHSAADGML